MRHPRHGRLTFVVVIVVAVGIAIALRQSAMFEDVPGPSHVATRVVAQVRAQDGRPAAVKATQDLWSSCSTLPDEKRLVSVGPGRIVAVFTPALGDDVLHRLVGCLEDLTVPGILGDVTSVNVEPIPAPLL